LQKIWDYSSRVRTKNPEIVPNLTIGYKLIISGADSKIEKTPAKILKQEVVKPEVVKAKPVVKPIVKEEVASVEPVKKVKAVSSETHEVKPKETLYSLTQLYSVSKEELIAMNPSLKEGVKIGMILKVPSKKGTPVSAPLELVSNSKYPDLTKTIKKGIKNVSIINSF